MYMMSPFGMPFSRLTALPLNASGFVRVKVAAIMWVAGNTFHSDLNSPKSPLIVRLLNEVQRSLNWPEGCQVDPYRTVNGRRSFKIFLVGLKAHGLRGF